MLGHIIDGHEKLANINGHVGDAVGHAEAAGAIHFPVIGPALAISLAVWSNGRAYRKGKVSLEDAVRNVGERGALAIVAGAAGWGAVVLAHEPFVGLPTSIVVRLFGGQFFHNLRRRKLFI